MRIQDYDVHKHMNDSRARQLDLTACLKLKQAYAVSCPPMFSSWL